MNYFPTIASKSFKPSHFLHQSNLVAKEWAGHSVRFIQNIRYFFAVRPIETASFIVVANVLSLFAIEFFIQPAQKRILDFLGIKEEKELKKDLTGCGIVVISSAFFNFFLYHLTWGAVHPIYFVGMTIIPASSRILVDIYNRRNAFLKRKDDLTKEMAERRIKIDELKNEMLSLTEKMKNAEKQLIEINSLEKEINSLEEEIKLKEKDIQELSNPKTADKKLREILKRSKYDPKHSQSIKDTHLNEWKNAKGKLENKVKTKKDNLSALNKETTNITIQDLSKKIDLLQLKIDKKNRETERDQAELAGNILEFQKKIREINDIDAKFNALELAELARKNDEEQKKLQSQLDDSKNERIKLGTTKKELEDQVKGLDQIVQNIKNEKAKTQGDLVELQKRYTDLDGVKKGLEAQKQQLEKQKQQLEQEKQDHEATISKHEKDYKKLSKKLNELKQEHTGLKGQHDALTLTKDQQGATINKLIQEHEEAIRRKVAEIRTLDNQCSDLKEEIRTITRSKGDLENRNRTYAQTIQDFSTQIGNLQTELNQKKEALELARTKIVELGKTHDKELSALRQQLSTAKGATSDLEKQKRVDAATATKLEERIKKLEGEIAGHKATEENLRKERDGLIRDKSNVEGAKARADEECRRLEKENKALKKENEKLLALNVQHQENLQKLKKQKETALQSVSSPIKSPRTAAVDLEQPTETTTVQSPPSATETIDQIGNEDKQIVRADSPAKEKTEKKDEDKSVGERLKDTFIPKFFRGKKPSGNSVDDSGLQSKRENKFKKNSDPQLGTPASSSGDSDDSAVTSKPQGANPKNGTQSTQPAALEEGRTDSTLPSQKQDKPGEATDAPITQLSASKAPSTGVEESDNLGENPAVQSKTADSKKASFTPPNRVDTDPEEEAFGSKVAAQEDNE